MVEYEISELNSMTVDEMYDEYYRRELNEIGLDIDIDEPEGYPNKKALIKAIKSEIENTEKEDDKQVDDVEDTRNFELRRRESGYYKIYEDGTEEYLG